MINNKPSMFCNGECLCWTKNYDATGKCNICGGEVLPQGNDSLDLDCGAPDINFEGTPDKFNSYGWR